MRLLGLIIAAIIATAAAQTSGGSGGQTQGPVTYTSGIPPGMTPSEASAMADAGNLPYTYGANGEKIYTLP